MPKPSRRLVPVLVAGLVAACATSSPPSASLPATRPATQFAIPPASSQPAPASPSVAREPTPLPVGNEPPPLALEMVADGLAAPIGITSGPGGWLLVNEQAGRAIAIHPTSGERATALDIRDRVLGEGERGLLGLVLHPDWPADARAFVHYTDRDGNTVLSELAGSQDGDAAPALDPGSERVLLTVEQPFPNHNGGQLAFGPDGYLWMGLGDGGSGGDPLGHGQNPSTLLGAILRLDVSEPGAYAIPPDNPFADGANGAPEVYLYGMRNPWRFSFDPDTGALWIADVGQNAFEEIDRVDPVADAGANLGWNVMEASHCFDGDCNPEGFLMPVAEYGHDLGCSVTGGHVYRGAAIGGLVGWYVFGDYCSGLLFGIRSDTDGTNLDPSILAETGHSISSLGVDTDRELYVTDVSGGLLSRIVADG